MADEKKADETTNKDATNMADDNMSMVSAGMDGAEEAYVSEEMKQILADIETQETAIKDAKAALKDLRNAKRRQARLDEKEQERRKREREQREALALWRKLHDCDIRRGDGSLSGAFEFVTDEVLTRLIERRPAAEPEDTISAPADERTDTSASDGYGADYVNEDEVL